MILLVAPHGLPAQVVTATRISNINSASDNTGSGDGSRVRVSSAQARYFFAATGQSGEELWVAARHTQYSKQVKDIWPGAGSSSPRLITATDNGCYFFAEDNVSGISLWYSDGTTGGTRVVGAPIGSQSAMSNLEGDLSITTDGPDVYVTGRRAGISYLYRAQESNLDVLVPLTSIVGKYTWRADIAGQAGPGPRFFALAQAAHDDPNTLSTWVVCSDGAAAGTALVRSFPKFAAPFGPEADELRVVNPAIGVAVFSVWEPQFGKELWVTNGTSVGTQLVLDARPGTSSGYPSSLTSDGQWVYYACSNAAGDREFWRTGGQTANTALLVDIDWVGSSGPRIHGVVNTGPTTRSVLLTAWNGGQYRLYTWDMVNMSQLAVLSAYPQYWHTLPGGWAMLFDTGNQLWISNAQNWFTSTITRPANDFGIVLDFFSLGNGTGFIEQPVQVGRRARRLWAIDGGYTTARPIAELQPDSGHGDGAPRNFFRDGSRVFFGATESPTGDILQSLDISVPQGAIAGIRQFSPGPAEFVRLDSGAVLFVAGDNGFAGPAAGTELWATGGLPQSTFLLPQIAPGALSSSPRDLTKVLSAVYFSADDGVEGRELYVVDNSQSPTRVLVLGPPGRRGSDPESLIEVGNRLYFTADNGTNGRELYRLDPLTNLVTLFDLRPGALGSEPEELVDAGGELFFVADIGTGRSVCRFDPVNGLAVSLTPGTTALDAPSGLFAESPGRIVFAARDAAHGREPWRSLGTAATTALLVDIVPGTDSSDPELFRVASGITFCVARTPASGYEVFRLDGASPATATVLEVHPTGSSFPGNLVEFRGTLLFTADNGTSGNEPWQYDPGTSQLRLLANIAPEAGVPGNSFARNFFDAGGTILMSARDGLYTDTNSNDPNAPGKGRELYQVVSPATIPALTQTLGASCAVAGFSPQMSANGLPTIGNLAFSLSVQSAPPVCIALLAVSEPGGPFPFAGCWFHLNLPILFLSASLPANGAATVNLGVPQLPNAIGLTFVGQYLIMAPQDQYGATQAIQYRIGG